MAIQKAGRLQFQDLFDVVGVGSFAANFANSATGLGVRVGLSFTVAGAALGDIVLVGAAVDTLDAVLVGHVTAANTVEVQLLNNTAGAVDLPSQDLRIVVLRLNPAYAVV